MNIENPQIKLPVLSSVTAANKLIEVFPEFDIQEAKDYLIELSKDLSSIAYLQPPSDFQNYENVALWVEALSGEIVLPLFLVEAKQEYYLIKRVLFRHQRFLDWKDALVQSDDFKTPLYITPHACLRYKERYRQGISVEQAQVELKELIETGNGQVTGVPPDWLRGSTNSSAEMFLTFLDDEIALPIVFNNLYQDYVIKTVISRSMSFRAKKKNCSSPKKTKEKFISSGKKINSSEDNKNKRLKEKKKRKRNSQKNGFNLKNNSWENH